jgi:hypothetical protein
VDAPNGRPSPLLLGRRDFLRRVAATFRLRRA